MKNKTEVAWTPYRNLVTKILKDTRYNFLDEKFKEERTKIEKSVISSMKFETINGKTTEKSPLNKKKRKAN